jgi:hypothetical protein
VQADKGRSLSSSGFPDGYMHRQMFYEAHHVQEHKNPKKNN